MNPTPHQSQHAPAVLEYRTQCETCGARLNDRTRYDLCRRCAIEFSNKEFSPVIRNILRFGSIKANV